MSAFFSLQIYGLNLAVTASLSIAVAIVLAACFKSLPKKYAALGVGLAGSVIALFAAGIGTAFSFGILSNLAAVQSESAMPELMVDHGVTAIVNEQVEGNAVQDSQSFIAPEFPSLSQHSRTVASESPSPRLIPYSPSSFELDSEPKQVAVTGASIGSLLIICWLVGSGVMTVRHLGGLWILKRFLVNCRPVRDLRLRQMFEGECERMGVRSSTELLESDQLPAPVVVGSLHPKVVLPTNIACTLSSSQLRSVLVHELSHVRRNDHWFVQVQAIAGILYWWNPLVRLLSQRMNEYREMICDDIATLALDSQSRADGPEQYARSLVEIAERAVQGRYALGSLGIGMSSSSEMERRVERILAMQSGHVELSITKRFTVGLIAFAFMLSVGLVFAQVPLPPKPTEGEPLASQSVSTEIADDEQLDADKFGKPNSALCKIAGKVLNESGEPAVGVNVQVKSFFSKVDVTTRTDANGEFQVRVQVEEKALSGLKIVATSADGSQFGFYRVPLSDTVPRLDEILIRLEPTREARVKVTDGEGNPIQGASVAVKLRALITSGPALTNASGLANLQVPISETIESVVAWKDERGLDYKLYTLPTEQAGDKFAKAPAFPYDDVESLSLEGAAPLTVRVTDSKGVTVEGARSHVFLLKKAGSEQLNLSYFAEYLAAKTDSSGTVTFNWFPRWQEQIATVWPVADGFALARGNYDPATQRGELEVVLERTVPIRGIVTFPDGRPAANIEVVASGMGYSPDGFNASMTTDDSGRYEFLVAPNMIYMISIVDEEWAAPSQSGFAVLPDTEVDDRDFVLSRATRIYGRVLNVASDDPVGGKIVMLLQHGSFLSAMGDDVLPNPEKSKMVVVPSRVLSAVCGDDGVFEFFVGDGDYHLIIQGFDDQKFTIEGEREKQVDLHVSLPAKIRFTGAVVEDNTNRPVEGAVIQATSRGRVLGTGHDWKATTIKDGRFQVERIGEPTYLYVVNSNETMGAFTELNSTQKLAVIRLSELGSAKGRLLNKDGSGPAAGVKLEYAIQAAGVSGRLRKVVTTNAKGDFLLSSLVPGCEYDCRFMDSSSGNTFNITSFSVEAGQTFELGELKIPIFK